MFAVCDDGTTAQGTVARRWWSGSYFVAFSGGVCSTFAADRVARAT